MIDLVGVAFLEESKQGAGYPMNTDGKPATPVSIDKLGQAKAGSGHDCFLKGITVMLDIEAPAYVWQQVQRYHFFDIVSSQSKMHRLEGLLKEDDVELKEVYNLYKKGEMNLEEVLDIVPMGLRLKARCVTNYLQLKTMYHQRKNHRLQFWNTHFKEFCESLPEFTQLVLGE